MLHTSIRERTAHGEPWGGNQTADGESNPRSGAGSQRAGCTLIDVNLCPKDTLRAAATLVLALAAAATAAQTSATPGPPPSTGGFYPLKDVHRGQKATAWTVFTGTKPEPMEVEILGVLRGARGPGHDMILAQLRGAKPEYTGVVAGMSGSPVYIGDKLLGSLSYRIGQFSKDPIAGITPIEQMLEVRDLPVDAARTMPTAQTAAVRADGMEFQAMETPLVMSGFRPEAIKLWQEKMAGTGLEMVAAGGAGSGSSLPGGGPMRTAAEAGIEPGSAVSAQLVRGDLDISATCTVTYVDPTQLLACGHPILQAGPVALPMTTAEVVATLASPLNAFKIVNTGDTIGAFTEDRDAAIRGEFGRAARMIPVHITVHGGPKERKLNVEVLDLPSLTPQAVMVSVYDALLETNESSAETSYHVRGRIELDGHPAAPLDVWAAGGSLPPQLSSALQIGETFLKLYSNDTRQGAVRAVELDVDAIPRNLEVALESARVVSGDLVHGGDRVVIEATLHPWHEAARNVRIPITLPARLQPGNIRVLVSDAGTLDRTLDQPRLAARQETVEAVLAATRQLHAADQVYVSLLAPETQAEIGGQTLTGLPLSMANSLEPLRQGQSVALNGESAVVAGQVPAEGVVSGFVILTLHIEDGGGLN